MHNYYGEILSDNSINADYTVMGALFITFRHFEKTNFIFSWFLS